MYVGIAPRSSASLGHVVGGRSSAHASRSYRRVRGRGDFATQRSPKLVVQPGWMRAPGPSYSSRLPDVSGTAWRRSGAPGRPGVHSPVDRRSKAPRRAGADIARALPVGWLRPVTAGVCGVVLPGRLALAGSGLCGRWAIVCGWLPGGEAGCCGVGLAVVPGQGIAGLPGPAGDGVVAYLAAGDRKMGDGHGEAPGTWLARHLL